MSDSISRTDFEKVVSEYGTYVFQVAWRLLGNVQDAQDVTQETFVKVYRSWRTYDQKKKLKNWICTIAINTCRDIFRGRKLAAIDCSSDPEQRPAEERIEERYDQRRAVSRMLRTLNPELRTVVVLYYFERLTIKEIAAMIGRPEFLIKVRLFRARQTLVQKFGGMEL